MKVSMCLLRNTCREDGACSLQETKPCAVHQYDPGHLCAALCSSGQPWPMLQTALGPAGPHLKLAGKWRRLRALLGRRARFTAQAARTGNRGRHGRAQAPVARAALRAMQCCPCGRRQRAPARHSCLLINRQDCQTKCCNVCCCALGYKHITEQKVQCTPPVDS